MRIRSWGAFGQQTRAGQKRQVIDVDRHRRGEHRRAEHPARRTPSRAHIGTEHDDRGGEMAWLVHTRPWQQAEFLLVERVIDHCDRTRQRQAQRPPTAELKYTVEKAALANWIQKGRDDLGGTPTSKGWASHNAILTGRNSPRGRALLVTSTWFLAGRSTCRTWPAIGSARSV
jgi:hypothetical protein